MRNIFVVLLTGFAWSSTANALPTCTVGPYNSSTPLATVTGAIANAGDGAVVCLQRGSGWSKTGGVAIPLTRAHSNRVTICSSVGNECVRGTTSGSNARLTMTDNGGEMQALSFSGSAGGYLFQDIDIYAINSCSTGGNDVVMGWLPQAARDITFRGGVWDGWAAFVRAINPSPTQDPTNIRLGDGPGADRIEARNCVENGYYSIPIYGRFDDMYIAIWLHHWGQTQSVGGQGHIASFHFHNEAYGQPVGTFESNRVTFEHNLWEWQQGAVVNGAIIRFSRGTDAVVKNNTFRVNGMVQSCWLTGPGFHSHGGADNAANRFWKRGLFENNYFELGDCNQVGIENQHGSDVEVRNNVFNLRDTTIEPDYWGTVIDAGNPSPLGNHNNFSVHHNTFYVPMDQSPNATIRFDSTGTGYKFYNNLIHSGDSNATPMQIASCNSFGTNGVEIKNNFVYTPKDSTPSLPACSASSGWKPGSPWNTAPGFVNAGAGDFHLVSTSSPAYGTGAFGVSGSPPPPPPSKLSIPGVPLILR